MNIEAKPIPTQTAERIEFVDILRGFALFGVLAMNMNAFSGHSFTIRQITDSIDKSVVFLLQFFLQAKFYSLFSFLFGWGMATQLKRAKTRGTRFIPIILRRNAILLGIGLVHGFLIWDGDILTVYALLAFLLILFRNRSLKTILISSIACLSLSIILTLPGNTLDEVRLWYSEITNFMRHNTHQFQLYGSGNYAEILQLRKEQFISLFSNFLFWFGNIFSMFLLGLYVGKRGIFKDIHDHTSLIRKVMWIGLFLGLIFNGIFIRTYIQPDWVPDEFYRLATSGARTIGAPALMLFYVCLIITLFRKESWYSRLTLLAPMGRMALSNYLMQSVLCTLIFYGYGLGLYGQISPTVGLILSIFIYIGQMRFSASWMERYDFGPMEWLWRSLTYGRLQPIRRSQTSSNIHTYSFSNQILNKFKRVPSRIALFAAWAFLVIWGTGLLIWNHSLSSRRFQEPVTVVVKVTATPEEGGIDKTGEQGEPTSGVISTPVVEPVRYNPGPISASGDMLSLTSVFDVEHALTIIGDLAGPTFSGRYAGTAGGIAAGDYIAEKYETFGLQPAGDDGTYFQTFPIQINQLADIPTLVIKTSESTRRKASLYQDFSPITSRYIGSGNTQGEIFWANQCTPDILQSYNLIGKVVLCQGVVSTEDILNTGRQALEYGAVGLLLLTDPESRSADFTTKYYLPWVPRTIPAFRVFPGIIDEILSGTDLTIKDIKASLPPMQLETSASLELETLGASACPTDGCTARNVLGVIPGRDPAYSNEVILIGGHYDHMGASPDGTIWYGADDNASGIAVLLEIARSWQAEGFVPKRTVVFAAWDAEELGLLGSIHYVQNPVYPLEETVAMVQLDMVGAGAEMLNISGEEKFKSQILSTAEFLGVEAVDSDMGNSDHVPFWQAGIPASLIIWWDESTLSHVHRPNDTPASIKPDKFEEASHVAELALLNLAENEPAIFEMLEQRSDALSRGDRSAFLETSLAEQLSIDAFWFDELQTMNPISVSLRSDDLQISGDNARAIVQIEVEHEVSNIDDSENDVSLSTANLDAKFVRGENGWLWSGPQLVEEAFEPDSPSFHVLYPPEEEQNPEIGELALEKYETISNQFGLAIEPDNDLFLMPSSEALRSNIALTLPPEQNTWVSPGEIHLVYDSEILTSTYFTTTLTQLVLANAGIPQSAFAWLWEGLPLIVRAGSNPEQIQSALLPELASALDIYPSSITATFSNEETVPLTIENDETPPDQIDLRFTAMSWAATDFLLNEYGWSGLGKIIDLLGESCQKSGCQSEPDIENAYLIAINENSQEFKNNWQNHWRTKMESIQSSIDSLLISRMEAAASGDIDSFLLTVDSSIPNLISAEHSWISNLISKPPLELSISGQLSSIHVDEVVLASINLDYQLESGIENQLSYPILVNLSDVKPLWMGSPHDIFSGNRVDVLYPPGVEHLAQEFQSEVDYELTKIANTLEISPTGKLTLELFNSPESFRSSIYLNYPVSDRTSIWTAKDENVKLLISPGSENESSLQEYESKLSSQITRWLLFQSGVESEWLINGVSSLMTRPFDGGNVNQAIGGAYPEILTMLEDRTLPRLSSLSQDYLKGNDKYILDRTLAWDSIRYLVETYGMNQLLNILHYNGKGNSIENSMQTTLGISLEKFEDEWRQSLSQGHISDQWHEIAETFDGQSAISFVDLMTNPLMKGRQTGTPGGQLAQETIAEMFSEFGLIPAGNPEGTSYFQQFAVTNTIMSTAPRFEIIYNDAPDFIFKEDFSPTRAISVEVKEVSGELVWVGDYDSLEFGEVLSDTIIVRPITTEIDSEINQAISHGAVGVILAGDAHDNQIYAKKPEIFAYANTSPIPVFELTRSGTSKLLESTGEEYKNTSALPSYFKFEIIGEMEFRLPDAKNLPTSNVLGLLPGSDPFLKQEVIIIGAHYDHVGDDPLNGLRYSGANDDASGIGGLLEIARVWNQSNYRPKRSVLFAAWGAQEIEQAGSSFYTSNPIFSMENIIGIIQMDGIAGGDGFYPNIQGEWERDGQLLLKMRTDGKLIITEQIASSDHISFHNFPIPTLLVTWRLANEDNLPDGFSNQVSSERLEICGEMVILALMAIAR